jgi:hypothetical protein
MDNLNVNDVGFPGPYLQTVSPTGAASAQAFGTAAVSTRITVSPTGVASAQAFGTDALSARITVSPSGISSAQAFGAAVLVVNTTQVVRPTGIASAQAVGSAVVTPGAVILRPTGIASATALGAVVLLPDQVVYPSGIASAEAFGTPALRLAWFVPPTITEGPVAPGPLFGRYKLSRGLTVLRNQDGSYSTVRYPAQTELEEASAFYLGGHMYPLSMTEIDDLIAAGYGDYIIYG